MKRAPFLRWSGLAALALVAAVLPLRAGTIAADALPLPNRVAAADVVIVGKVVAFEEKPISAAPFPGAKKTEYKIAVITVSDPLQVPKGLANVRLGFVPPPFGVVISPPPFQPNLGQEGIYFLTRHGEGDFMVAHTGLNFLGKTSGNFDKDVALVKRCTKLLKNPDASLKSKNAEDRFLTAGMLVARYLTRKGPNVKTEPIDAEQSKLILQALASADWTPTNDFTRLSPLMVLHRLPLTKDDGWAPPARDNPKAYAAYAQQWVQDHAATYRIRKFVAEKSE